MTPRLPSFEQEALIDLSLEQVRFRVDIRKSVNTGTGVLIGYGHKISLYLFQRNLRVKRSSTHPTTAVHHTQTSQSP